MHGGTASLTTYLLLRRDLEVDGKVKYVDYLNVPDFPQTEMHINLIDVLIHSCS